MGPVGMGPEEAAALSPMPVFRMVLERMAPSRTTNDLVPLERYTDGSGDNGAEISAFAFAEIPPPIGMHLSAVILHGRR